MIKQLKQEERAILDRLNHPSEHDRPDEYEVEMLKRLSVVHMLMLAWVFGLSTIAKTLFGICIFAKYVLGRKSG